MLRTSPGSRPLRALVLAGGIALVTATWPSAALAAPSPTPSAPAPTTAACPDPHDVLLAMSASRAWAIAGGKGAGATVSVIGTPEKAAEAQCSVLALAPEALVRVFPVTGADAKSLADVQAAAGSGGAVVLFADTAVDLADRALASALANAEAQGVVIIAATGDGLPAMPRRPSGIINVSAADLATRKLHPGSASGPTVTLAGYGDTATAAGYVAAAAALVRTAHTSWPARQVAAQLAGSINPVSGSPRDDQLGYGVLQPVQALSLGPIDPASLPGFAALFPEHPAPAPGATGSPGVPAGSQLVGASQPPSAQQDQVPAVSVPSAAQNSAAKSDSGGGPNKLFLVGFGALLAAGALVIWQRRRTPAPVPLKQPDEWEPPSGQRHSGYSTPPE